MAAALVASEFSARVVWLGRVGDRDAALASAPVEALRLGWGGAEGEAHSGLTRAACARVRAVHPEGSEIRNTRQISLVSGEELAEVAEKMALDRLDPGWIGATLVVEGIPDFSHLPPSSRLQAPDGATLTVDLENLPCTLAGRSLEAARPGHGARFKPAAMGLRGVTAWVEREGWLRLGDPLKLFVPAQRAWAP